MLSGLQVTFDASDPHQLARCWADLLGYEVENNHERVSALLDQGVITDDWAVLQDPEGNEFCLH